jgi:hypothetical protein
MVVRCHLASLVLTSISSSPIQCLTTSPLKGSSTVILENFVEILRVNGFLFSKPRYDVVSVEASVYYERLNATDHRIAMVEVSPEVTANLITEYTTRLAHRTFFQCSVQRTNLKLSVYGNGTNTHPSDHGSRPVGIPWFKWLL